MDWEMIEPVLAPSAGKGDLALAVQQKYKFSAAASFQTSSGGSAWAVRRLEIPVDDP